MKIKTGVESFTNSDYPRMLGNFDILATNHAPRALLVGARSYDS